MISPHMLGLEATTNLPTASTLCGACGEVCPVKIPIPKILLRLRQESVKPKSQQPQVMKGQGAGRNNFEALIWKVWALVHKSPKMYGLSMWGLTRFRFLMPKKLGGWTSVRTAPKPAAKTLHERINAKKAKKSQQERG
jgi:L-lactate dehydrogenase complex protein LldF